MKKYSSRYCLCQIFLCCLLLLCSFKAIVFAQAVSSYTITYHLNGGNNSAANPFAFAEGQAVALDNPERTGYQFDGWFLDNAYQTPIVPETFQQAVSGLHAYAKWTKATYHIQYNNNGGNAVNSNPTTYQYQQKVQTLKPSTRAGYQFVGWYDTATGVRVSKITQSMTGDISLIARWDKVTSGTVKGVKIKQKGLQMSVSFKAAKGAHGYEVVYWDKATKVHKTVIAAKTKLSVLKLKQGSTYVVKVRSYNFDSLGKKVYGKYSAKVSCTVPLPKSKETDKDS
jgi:uncharacterized repeat protein (TIGR02543 family)